MTFKAAAIAGMAMLVAGPLALAHHSGAMFERTKEITLVGTIKEILWVNPHSWIDITVKDAKGKDVVWGIEASTPSGFARMGMKRSPPYPAPGDKVTMVIHPLRDGRPGGSFITMTLADGTTFNGVNPFGPATLPPGGVPPGPPPGPPPSPPPGAR